MAEDVYLEQTLNQQDNSEDELLLVEVERYEINKDEPNTEQCFDWGSWGDSGGY